MISSLLIADGASVAAPARAITTIDVPAGRLSRITVLKISRTRRFTRFRATAIPTRRDTVTPSRERPRPVFRTARRITCVNHEVGALESHAGALEADEFRASMQPVCRREAQLRAHGG